MILSPTEYISQFNCSCDPLLCLILFCQWIMDNGKRECKGKMETTEEKMGKKEHGAGKV